MQRFSILNQQMNSLKQKLHPSQKNLSKKNSIYPRAEFQRKGKNFSWGYNRSSYTQSDINFKGPGYKFTLQDVTAQDKPELIDSTYLNPTTFDVPQFNWRWGKYLTDSVYFSLGQDL